MKSEPKNKGITMENTTDRNQLIRRKAEIEAEWREINEILKSSHRQFDVWIEDNCDGTPRCVFIKDGFSWVYCNENGDEFLELCAGEEPGGTFAGNLFDLAK